MIIEHYLNGKEFETYHIYNEDNVEVQAQRCLDQLCLHESVKGVIFGNPNGLMMTVDTGSKFHKFYIYK